MVGRTIHQGYLEYEIGKYERRIQRIKENPDPTKPKANILLYEAERDLRKAQLEAWRKGEPFGYLNPLNCLGKALGFQTCDMVFAADRTHGERAGKYFDLIRREGFTDNACDRTTVLLPMVLNGDFPAPNFMITSSHECAPIYLTLNSLARQLGIPVFPIDRPPRYNEETLRYVTRQLENLIDYAQSTVPGVRFDEDRLVELQGYERQWWDTWRDIYKLRRRVPCPIPGKESFREIRMPSIFTDPPKIVAYQRAYRDELCERADKGLGAVEEERLRLLWGVSGPFYDDPFGFLENLGVTVPIWHVTNFTDLMAGRQHYYGDETTYGRKLSPLEEEARRMNFGWGDLADRWVNSIIDACRDLQLEGIVYYLQWGCTVTNNLGKVVSDRAERELGIPTLLIEGRQLDETVYDRRDFFTKLVDFVNVCFERKGLPSLSSAEVVKAGFAG